ncbi:MAG: FG-GAP repeat domain-containing protein [Planctomycetota bacterium]|jgi:hypothetical protein
MKFNNRTEHVSRIMAVTLLFVAACLVFYSAAVRAKGYDFRQYKIEAPGWITTHVVEDFNGDGRSDLVLISGREIRFWAQCEEGVFEPAYSQKFSFDNSAIFFDVGDIDGDNRFEILFLRRGGVSAYMLENENCFSLEPKLVLAAESLLTKPADTEVKRKRFFKDFTGDGKCDILLPRAGRYAVYACSGKGSFSLAGEVRVEMSAAIQVDPDNARREISAQYWFPAPVSGDFNGDNLTDLLLQEGDFLAVFAGEADGAFKAKPSSRISLGFVQAGLTRSGKRPGFQLEFTLPVVSTDIDNNGIIDLAWTEVAAGSVRIFLGKEGGSDLEKPDQIVRVEGYAFHTAFVDVDGDGLRDLVVVATDRFGVWDAIKTLITRSVPLKAFVYINRKEKLFGVSPDLVKTAKVPLLVRQVKGGIKVGSPVVADFSGDFNRDGKKDLLLKTGDTGLSIFFGTEDSVLAEKPGKVVEIPTTAEHKIVTPIVGDFNDDGVSDVFLHYWSWGGDADRIYFFLSESR